MKTTRLTLMLVTLSLLSIPGLQAQEEARENDLPGSKDHPFISRFQGAIIQNYQVADYEEYVLGTGMPVEKQVGKYEKYFSDYINLEGKLIRIQYIIPEETGILQVYRNYEMAIKNSGYDILYHASHKDTETRFWELLYDKDYGINKNPDYFWNIRRPEEFYFLTAKGFFNNNDVYIALYVSYGEEWDAKRVLVNLDIIEVKPMKTGLVSAADMEKSLATKGHLALYGILFDTGKSVIKTESEPTLKNIAVFIKSNAGKNYFIVGHTDNVGAFDANMVLSSERANSIRDHLVNKLGVDAAQLQSHGIGPLSPVASNSAEEGRARNRRVEIVEQ